MMKKVFYVSLGLLILTLIFLGAYNFAFKHNVNDPTVGDTSAVIVKDTEDEEVAVPLTIENPINEMLLGATLLKEGDGILYYSLDDKAVKKASLQGKDKEVLVSNLPGEASRLLLSPKGDQALVLLKGSDGKSLWYLLTLSNKSLVPLKPEMSRLAWNNLGDKILYQFTDPATGNRTLNSASPDGSNWKKLADVGKNDSFSAAVPRSTDISFWTRPNALEETTLEAINLSGENRRTLLTGRFGADYLWSPNGEQVLVSTSSEKGGSGLLLNLMNKQGGEFKSLSIPTLVSKVTWAENGLFLYYALPGALPGSAVLPNDYFEKSLHTTDTFWKLDLQTGKKSRLVDLQEVGQSFDSIDLFLSPKEDMLFFTDRKTKRLYKIDL